MHILSYILLLLLVDRSGHSVAGNEASPWKPLEFTPRMEWQVYYSQLCALHIGQQQMCSLLGRLRRLHLKRNLHLNLVQYCP